MSSHDESPVSRADAVRARLAKERAQEHKMAIGSLEERESSGRTYSLSAYMRAKREAAGLSMRQAAKQTGISEGRWRQLESGYQSVGGEKLPVKTTVETVLRIAAGVDMDPDLALEAAGFDPSVKVKHTGIWPLPKHVTVGRDPAQGSTSVVKESHVTSGTLRRAKQRLRKLETLCEDVQTLPLADLEYLRNFTEQLIDDAHGEQARIEAEADERMRQLKMEQDGWEEN